MKAGCSLPVCSTMPGGAACAPTLSHPADVAAVKTTVEDFARAMNAGDGLEAHNDFEVNRKAEEGVRAILDRLSAQDEALARIVEALAAAGLMYFANRAHVSDQPRLVNPAQVTSAAGVEDYPSWWPRESR